MQSLIRSKSAGVTGGRGTAGAGPGRDLLYNTTTAGRGLPTNQEQLHHQQPIHHPRHPTVANTNLTTTAPITPPPPEATWARPPVIYSTLATTATSCPQTLPPNDQNQHPHHRHPQQHHIRPKRHPRHAHQPSPSPSVSTTSEAPMPPATTTATTADPPTNHHQLAQHQPHLR